MTTHFARYYYIVFAMICCSTLMAQDYLVSADLITTSDGLSGITTYSIVQDNDQYVWVSTVNGLDRFDGGNFNFFSADDYQLKEKYISRIVVDSNDLLWLLNAPKLLDRYSKYPIKKFSVFDTRSQVVIPAAELERIKEKFLEDNYFLPKTSGWPNRAFFSNDKGEIWKYKKPSFQLFKNGLPGAVQSVINTEEALLMAVENYLYEVDLKGNTQNTIQLPNQIIDLWEGEAETIWAATLKEKTYPLLEIWKVLPDKTTEQLFFKDAQGQPKELPFKADRGDHIYRTKAGLWLVNLEDYVDLYTPEGELILQLNQTLQSNYSFGFRGVVELENTLLLATSGGVIRLTIRPNRFNLIHAGHKFSNSRSITKGPNKSILFNETFIEKVDSNYQNSETIFSESAGFSLYYRDSLIWFGNGYKDDIVIFEKNLFTGATNEYDLKKGVISYCIRPSRHSNLLWVGSSSGLSLLDVQQKKAAPFTKINDFSDLEKSSVKFIYENTAGFWLATNYGIFLIDQDQGVLRQFNQASGDLPFDDIAHIHEDEAGVFWLSTLGAGMIRWEPNLNSSTRAIYQVFDTKKGLSHDIVYGIQEDVFKRLWISSNNGLMLFNKEEETLITFLKEDGLPNSEFNLCSHYKAADGTLYFGGLGGIVAIDPTEFDTSTYTQTPLIWKSFKVLESDATAAVDQTKLLTENAYISFSPQQKFMEFEFKLLDFDQSDIHQYAYKIEGFSDAWNYLSTNSFRIAHLPYGKYNLRVKGGNMTNGWSTQELSLAINVPRPFFLQTWFFLAIVVAISLFTWFLIRWRTKQLQKDRALLVEKVSERTAKIEADKLVIEEQSRQLKNLDQLKTNFFTNITHELRTPLSLILGPAGQLSKKENQPPENQNLAKTIYKNAQKLLGLTDELLDLARIDAGTLDLVQTDINLHSFLKDILENYQEFADYQQIKYVYHFSFPNDLHLQLDAKKVEKILNNLLSNAFKFTPSQGTISVSGSWQEGQLQLEVSDTGRGITSQAQPFIFDRYFQSNVETNQLGIGGSGIGLAICKEYLHLMGGSIQLNSKPNKGATFSIILPAVQVIKSQAVSMSTSNDLSNVWGTESELQYSHKSGSKSKYQLLIVEDNIELASYLKKVLAKSYTIQLANNGKEAWQLIQQERFDLLISDVMMPQMNGVELLSKVKAHADYQNIPFMMLTALTASEERLKALRIGVDDYLQKPFLTEEVELRIKLLLDRYSIRKANSLESKIPLSADESWLKYVEEKTLELVSDSGFTVVQLATVLNISERNLFNKIRALVGTSPGAYIREVRLNLARELLEQKQYKTVAEVCYAVGFQKPSYFTQLFKKRFGHLPSKYFK